MAPVVNIGVFAVAGGPGRVVSLVLGLCCRVVVDSVGEAGPKMLVWSSLAFGPSVFSPSR